MRRTALVGYPHATMTEERVHAIAEKLAELRPSQLGAIEAAIGAFASPVTV